MDFLLSPTPTVLCLMSRSTYNTVDRLWKPNDCVITGSTVLHYLSSTLVNTPHLTTHLFPSPIWLQYEKQDALIYHPCLKTTWSELKGDILSQI